MAAMPSRYFSKRSALRTLQGTRYLLAIDMSQHETQTVLSIRHWTETLFSFTCTRSPSFRFENGQFTMVGLEVEGRPLMRAYSIASANYQGDLEFFSIKVPDGPLTSRLQHLREGDPVLIGKRPSGTLIVDNLLPGRNLWMLSTGTGLAPFLSVIRDPSVYERFDRIVLTHTCRQARELAYRDTITQALPNDECLGELVREKLVYYPSVTREAFEHRGRITELIASGRIFSDLGFAPFSSGDDRLMLCGSAQMLKDTRMLLEDRGLEEGSQSSPGHFVVERAFVS